MTPPQHSEEAIYQIAVFASLAHEPPNIPDERILMPLSLTLWNRGRVSEAVTGFRLLDRSGALPMKGILARGWWLLYEAELGEAEELFSRALKTEPDNDEASLGMAFLRFYQEDYSSAAGLFFSLAAREKFSSPKTMAPAAKALAEGRRPKAIQSAPLLGLPPGLAHLYQKRQLDGKDAAIQLAQSQIPSAPRENLLPIQRLVLEWQLEDPNADAAQLRAELEALLKDYPDEGRLWQFLGIVLRRLELRAESRDAFQHAASSAPLDAGAWAGYGASLMEARELEQAYHYYETAVFLDPDAVQYLTELATCYGGLEQWRKAEEKFTEAAKRGASGFDLYFNRAACRLKLGDFGLAMEDLRAALEIEPTHHRAAEAREILQLERSAGVAATDDRFRFGDL
jgi:tetratricopeptide (TPR) repeat protein